ncbi:cell adhesion molecule 2-like [Anomaloglossus baeobatrachus]
MAVEKDVDLTSKTTSKKYTDLCLSKIYKNELACLKLFVPQTHKARLGENVQIPCSFSVDKSPVDRSLLKIIWYFQGKQVLSVEDKSKETIDPRLSYVDKASDGNADLHISNTLLSDGGLYKCSVIYSNQRKEAEVRLDIQASPQVTITDNTVVLNAESILRCSATGFYPVDIDIKWFRGSERLSDVTEDLPLRNQDGLYSVNSTVTITPTEEDRKQNFSCRVQHESLQQPHQETFQLLYGAIPTIHILPHTFIKNVQQPLVCLLSHGSRPSSHPNGGDLGQGGLLCGGTQHPATAKGGEPDRTSERSSKAEEHHPLCRRQLQSECGSFLS